MKKFIAPIVLFVLASALAVYLTMDLSVSGKSFDAESYLVARSKIDSLEQALWNAKNSPDVQVTIRMQLDSAWENLSAMRTAPEKTGDDQVTSIAGIPLSFDTLKWIAGGVAAIALCVVILILILRKRQEIITRRMEAIKAERFKEPKAGLDDATIPPRHTVKSVLSLLMLKRTLLKSSLGLLQKKKRLLRRATNLKLLLKMRTAYPKTRF